MIVKIVNRLVSLLNSDPTEFALCTVVIYEHDKKTGTCLIRGCDYACVGLGKHCASESF